MADLSKVSADPTAAVLAGIDSLKSRLSKVEAENSELKTKMASTPVYPGFLNGQAPFVTTGAVGQDSQGYSILRAAAYAMNMIGKDQCKEEVETHVKLKALYTQYGYLPYYGGASFFVPNSTADIPQFEPQGQKIANELRQKMVASVAKYDPEEARWIQKKFNFSQKAMGTISDAAGGALVGFPTLGELIDLQRNMEAFTKLGAISVTLPPNARMQFPKLTGGSTAYWVGEGNPTTSSDQSTGNLNLEGKKLGILTKINNELLRYASGSAEGMIRQDMARVGALKADLAMLQGTGGTQPIGLINYETQPSWSTGSDKLITYTVTSNLMQPQDVNLAVGKLPDEVQDQPLKWLMRNELWGAISSRRADAVSAADGKGPFVFNLTRGTNDMIPKELNGFPVVTSSQVSNTRSTDKSYFIVGNWADWLIGRFGVMEFQATALGDTPFVNDQTWLRAIQIIDGGARHAASFVFADSISLA